MDGVPGVESHHPLPSQFFAQPPDFSRRHPELLKIEMKGKVDHLEATADIRVAASVHEVVDPGMGRIQGAVDALGFFFLVGGKDVFDVHHGQEKPLGIPERDGLARLQGAGGKIAHIRQMGRGQTRPFWSCIRSSTDAYSDWTIKPGGEKRRRLQAVPGRTYGGPST